MRYEVKPSQSGDTAFGTVPIGFLKKADSVTTDKCYRCFGGAVIMHRKNTNTSIPESISIIYHIVPGKMSYIKSMASRLFAKINHFLPDYHVQKIFRCGGRIDNKQNRFLYEQMYHAIDQRFIHTFKEVKVEGIYPDESTQFTELEFDHEFIPMMIKYPMDLD